MSFACNTVPREEIRDPSDTVLRSGRVRAGRAGSQAPSAAAVVAREASIPGRTLAHGATLRVLGAVLRIRRGALLPRRRGAGQRGRGTARRIHAPRGRLYRAIPRDGGPHGGH